MRSRYFIYCIPVVSLECIFSSADPKVSSAELMVLRIGEDLFIGPQEFVVGYSKAPEQPQSSARPICHSHTMTRTGHEPATVRIAA